MVEESMKRVLEEHARAFEAVRRDPAAAVAAGEAIVAALERGGTVLVCGNGGSAADAQHLAAEIVGRFVERGRRALPAIALTTDSSALTAIANDFGYEAVFARQVAGLAKRGDVLVGLSTSGRSANVLQALETARALGVTTILMCGPGAEAAMHVCDHVVCVGHSETARIQEMHQMIYHAWCEAIDQRFSEA